MTVDISHTWTWIVTGETLSTYTPWERQYRCRCLRVFYNRCLRVFYNALSFSEGLQRRKAHWQWLTLRKLHQASTGALVFPSFFSMMETTSNHWFRMVKMEVKHPLFFEYCTSMVELLTLWNSCTKWHHDTTLKAMFICLNVWHPNNHNERWR